MGRSSNWSRYLGRFVTSFFICLLCHPKDASFAAIQNREKFLLLTHGQTNNFNIDGAAKENIAAISSIPTRPLEIMASVRHDDGRSVRKKRKVISRGGHYIIRSKIGGGSPWGSPRGSTNPFSTEWKRDKKYHSSGGWNLSDNLRLSSKNYALDASGGSRYSSGTLRRYVEPPPTPKERKKISKALKFEIAQFALRNGVGKAAKRYESEVGRKLKERIIEKFATRYVNRTKRKNARKI